MNVLLNPLHCHFEQYVLRRYFEALILFKVLSLDCAKIDLKLVIIQNKAFMTTDLTHKIIDVVVVNRVSDMLVIYHNIATFVELGH